MRAKDCFCYFKPFSEAPLPPTLPPESVPLLSAITDIMSRHAALSTRPNEKDSEVLNPTNLESTVDELDISLHLSAWLESLQSYDEPKDDAELSSIAGSEIITRFEIAYPPAHQRILSDYERRCLALSLCLLGAVVNHSVATTSKEVSKTFADKWRLSASGVRRATQDAIISFTTMRCVREGVMERSLEIVMSSMRSKDEDLDRQELERHREARRKGGKNSKMEFAPVRKKCIEYAHAFCVPVRKEKWPVIVQRAYDNLTVEEQNLFAPGNAITSITRWLQNAYPTRNR